MTGLISIPIIGIFIFLSCWLLVALMFKVLPRILGRFVRAGIILLVGYTAYLFYSNQYVRNSIYNFFGMSEIGSIVAISNEAIPFLSIVIWGTIIITMTFIALFKD